MLPQNSDTRYDLPTISIFTIVSGKIKVVCIWYMDLSVDRTVVTSQSAVKVVN